MGMAASQVRFLSLQNRKNTIGLNLMTLSNRKTSLSRDMNRVAAKYNDAMNQKMLKWSNDSGSTYQNLNYDLLMKQNENNGSLPYIVSTADGKVVVDDKQLTDSDGQALKNADGSALTYKELATMISTYSGTTKNSSGLSTSNYNYTNNVSTDGTKGNASKDGYEYIVSSASDGYSYSNALRYDLFKKMGIISSSEVQSFASINDSIYGNEIGHNSNNYKGLLDQYVTAGLTNTASSKSISLSKTDGSGMTSVDSSVYFGTWSDSTSKLEGGSKLGNVALAQHDLQQYKEWCNQPHDASLTAATTFNFTDLSGRAFTQSTNAVLSALDSASTSDAEASTSKITSQFDEKGSSGAFNNWSSVYDSSYAAVNTTGFSGDSMNNLLAVIGSSLYSAFTDSSNTESSDTDKGWSLANSSADDQVTVDSTTFSTKITSGTSTKMDLATAASKWALKQTVNFYSTTASNVNYTGSDSNPVDHAASSGDGYNGVSSAKKKKSILGSIISWAAAAAAVASVVVSAGATSIIAGAVVGGGGAALFSGGGNKSYTFNVKDFAKTYFTFYEMYMAAKGDTTKLSPIGNTTTMDDNSVADSVAASGVQTNLLTTTANTWTSNGTLGTTSGKVYYLKSGVSTPSSAGDILGAKSTSTSTGYIYGGNLVESDHILVTDTDGSTGYVDTRSMYTDQYGNTVNSTYNKSDNSRTTTYTNAAGLSTDGTTHNSSYKKITIDINSTGDTSYSYYTNVGDTTALAQPTTTVPSAGCSYNGLTVNNSGSVFTDKVQVYLTPNASILSKLQKTLDDANADLAAAEASRDTVFSTEESKQMDYYDALFKRISQNGWVYDSKVNSSTTQTQSSANNYLNAMLENNMYYVTEVDENNSETGSYSYTNKLATNISKIFQVEDTSAENVAESEYETEKTEISNKEERVDLRMNQLETEQSAITTELDSIKKIISDNVTSTFKIFT